MSRLQTLTEDMSKVRAAIQSIEDTAKAEARDLNDDESKDVEVLVTRATNIRTALEAETAVEAASQKATEILSRASAPKTNVDLSNMTVGTYLEHIAEAKNGNPASQQLIRSVAQNASSDLVVPQVITGSWLDLFAADRPAFSSMAHPGMSQTGSGFDRPRITQHVAIGDSTANEFGMGASQKFTMTLDHVSKAFHTGNLEVSQRAISWVLGTGALDLALNDFGKVYARYSEGLACSFLSTSASASVSWTATNIQTMATSILNAVPTIYNACFSMPDTLWLSLTDALTIAGKLSTQEEVTATQVLRQVLSDAGIPIKIVVAPQLTSGQRILGVSGYVEGYENSYGMLQVVNTAVFGYDVAYAAETAFYTLPSSKALVKLV